MSFVFFMKTAILFSSLLFITSCNNLSFYQKQQIEQLKNQGITVDTPVGKFKKPASRGLAAGLNVLPGVGSFYLGVGEGADSSHILYGVLNLLTWPLSIAWAVPEAFVDADNINKQEMLSYYTYNKVGKKELKQAGIKLDNDML